MRVALVVPQGKHEMNKMGVVARPPLGVCYLKSYLISNNYPDVRIFHQVDETNDEIVGQILAFNPDIVGFSVMSSSFRTGTELARLIKKSDDDIVTVFGGEHISCVYADEVKYDSSLLSRSLKTHPEIDVIVPYEGERTLLDLVRTLENGPAISGVNGIAFLRDGKVLRTGYRERIQDLDLLPIPDRSDLPYHKYVSVDDSADLEYMHTTRGCKFRCKYCLCHVSNPGKVVANSAARVLEELEMLHHERGRDSFFFADELFTYDPQRVADICNGLIDRGLSSKVNLRTFARVDDVANNRLDLPLIRKAGLRALFFGIESMNTDTLRLLRKRTNPIQVIKALEMVNHAGGEAWGSLMIGYPWETEEELLRSLDAYLKLSKRGLIKHTYVAFITPFPGTDFHQQCVKNDWITDPNYLESDCQHPALRTPISEERLVDIYQQFLGEIT